MCSSDLVDLGADLCEGGVGVVVEPQVHADRAEARAALRLDVVDAVGARHDPLDLGRDIATHGVGARAEVDGRDLDHRAVAARVLTRVQPEDGDQADNEDDDVDHQRDDRAPDEKVGEALGNHGGGGPGEPGRRVRCWAGAARGWRPAGRNY